jgi:hypothetical protein
MDLIGEWRADIPLSPVLRVLLDQKTSDESTHGAACFRPFTPSPQIGRRVQGNAAPSGLERLTPAATKLFFIADPKSIGRFLHP